MKTTTTLGLRRIYVNLKKTNWDRYRLEESITFNGISFSSSKQLAAKLNTSKLGRHTSSSETRLVTREIKRKPMEMTQTFIADLVMRAIKSCRNSKAFDPDKLSILHLKNLGPRAIEYITVLFNLYVTTCQIPAIWKSSSLYRSLTKTPPKDLHIGPSVFSAQQRVLVNLILQTINKYLLPVPDQDGFRPEYSTTSAAVNNRHRNGIQPEEAT